MAKSLLEAYFAPWGNDDNVHWSRKGDGEVSDGNARPAQSLPTSESKDGRRLIRPQPEKP